MFLNDHLKKPESNLTSTLEVTCGVSTALVLNKNEGSCLLLHLESCGALDIAKALRSFPWTFAYNWQLYQSMSLFLSFVLLELGFSSAI